MTVTAQLVKELRERTGSGMLECKKALVAAEGDIEKAIEEMRKSGQAKAVKKASRITAEGLIKVDPRGMLEINCETDFVGKDLNFTAFCDQAFSLLLDKKPAQLSDLSNMLTDSGDTLETVRHNLISKIGENITLRRFIYTQAGADHVGTYSHGGRIGVTVALKGGSDALAKQLAMHIAASKPLVVSPEDVPSDLVEKEKVIYVAQARDSGKPDNIIEKMIQGQINKFLNAQCLLGQPFVIDPNQKVSDVVKAAGAEVLSFTRYEVGEGIEKDDSDFAAEVMAQAGLANQ